jgi:hypothetical protein
VWDKRYSGTNDTDYCSILGCYALWADVSKDCNSVIFRVEQSEKRRFSLDCSTLVTVHQSTECNVQEDLLRNAAVRNSNRPQLTTFLYICWHLWHTMNLVRCCIPVPKKNLHQTARFSVTSFDWLLFLFTFGFYRHYLSPFHSTPFCVLFLCGVGRSLTIMSLTARQK